MSDKPINFEDALNFVFSGKVNSNNCWTCTRREGNKLWYKRCDQEGNIVGKNELPWTPDLSTLKEYAFKRIREYEGDITYYDVISKIKVLETRFKNRNKKVKKPKVVDTEWSW